MIRDDRNPGSKSYMWVHRSGEFYTERSIVIYEYQEDRNHELPLHFYQDYKGILVTDGISQYQLIEKKLPGLINSNCWAHARRDYADAIKIADKADPDAVRRSVAYQALSRISQIYKLEGALKDLSAGERLRERQNTIKPMVEEYFAWVKSQLENAAVLPKGKIADGNVPIDNSAGERAIRTFCIDKKNWMFHDSIIGAQASAIIYSILEAAKLNDLRPYYYFKYLLTQLPKLCDEQGNIDSAKQEHLLPLTKELPDECRKSRRCYLLAALLYRLT